MRCLVLWEHGGPGSLKYVEDFEDPVPVEDQVLIQVRASSMNYHDIFTRNGMPGIKIPLPMIVGLDVAGEIVEVGGSVTEWKIGDRVVVDPKDRKVGGLVGETIHGGMAEFCKVGKDQLLRIPENVTFEEAASLPVAYGTAYRMLMTRGRIRTEDEILILGASGGVGTACVLLAKMAGANVTVGASSEKKLSELAKLGASNGINYTECDIVTAAWDLIGKPHRHSNKKGFDVVVNFTGGSTWVQSLKVLKRGGRLLTCGATAGFAPETDIRYIWTFELDIRGSNGWSRQDLDALLKLVSAGKIIPYISSRLSLEEGAEAIRLIEERKVIGKVIVVP